VIYTMQAHKNFHVACLLYMASQSTLHFMPKYFLRDERNHGSNTISVFDIFVAKELDQHPFFGSCPRVEKSPQQDKVQDKAEWVLQHKLSAQCPIEKACIRRMATPGVDSVSN